MVAGWDSDREQDDQGMGRRERELGAGIDRASWPVRSSLGVKND